MAPSNLNQVFVINNPDLFSTTTFSNNAVASSSRMGVWDVDGGTNFVTALRAIPTDTTALGVWNKKRIQITQTTPAGNAVATPIIDTDSIKRINYREWTSVVPTVAMQTLNTGDPTSTKNVMVRIALRTAPTNYNSFADPNNAYADLSGAGYTFPLIGNFAAGRMIFNIEISAAEHAATEATFYAALATKVAANKTLNAMFVFDNDTTTADFIARHYGVEFDVTVQYSDNSGAVGTVSASHPTLDALVTDGIFTQSSNYIMALSDEKAQRSRYGNFNRMYFPFAFPEYAQPNFKYDVLEIQYAHSHPADTGIAKAGELNTVRIYFGAGTTALSYAGASTGTEIATVFGFTGGTDKELIF